ncbi:MAG TPA: protein kinase [Vicinamibacterales bacterium]
MALQAGTRLGAYEIGAPLGAGGMGEVYKARDTRLNRSVAIKILMPSLSADGDRLTRFAREAQVLASLNHPNIAQVFGFEEAAPGAAGGALVMELVEGPTLADRIARGAIPLDEALPIARQIADALVAAHAQGIVHRDLKPANVKIRQDGTVKVLDFGLAKLADADVSRGSSPDVVANSPTLTSPGTMGIILGTAAYMSPEQAKGKSVDKRADIWAFGVVLYEMLAGKPLFGGETISDVLASVLKDEPDWSGLPPSTPTNLRRLLRRCVERDPRRRLQDIGDARLELDEVEAPVAPAGQTGALAPRRVLPLIAIAALAASVATALVLLFALPNLRPQPASVVHRLSVLAPPGEPILFEAAESAVSPDGRSVVFAALNGPRIWIRPLDADAPRLLAGTEHGIMPFWSPDSTRVGFFADRKLKTITLSTGGIAVLCDAPDARGGTWNDADVIVFAPSNAGALMRVSAQGGDPRPVTTLDSSRKETAHRFPSFLPDGRHFLYTALPRPGNRYGVLVASLDGGPQKELMAATSSAVYAPPGYLLFERPNGFSAQRFDAGRLELVGDPFLLPDSPGGVGAMYSGDRPVTVSSTGTLVYLGGQIQNTQLMWIDAASGKETGTVDAPVGLYNALTIAPDGRHAAVVKQESINESAIWMVDLQRGGVTKFTSGQGNDSQPLWSPDSSRLAFASNPNGRTAFYVKAITGGSPETLLFDGGATFKTLNAWSHDGKSIVFGQLDPATGQDLWILPIDGDKAGAPAPYLRTPFAKTFASLSLDDRWAAYLSSEGGRQDLWVDSFPKPGERYRVTTGGALGGGFQRSGDLAFASLSDRQLYDVPLLPGKEFRLGPPRRLFSLPPVLFGIDIMPDGSKALMSVPVDSPSVTSLTVVEHWTGALPRR